MIRSKVVRKLQFRQPEGPLDATRYLASITYTAPSGAYDAHHQGSGRNAANNGTMREPCRGGVQSWVKSPTSVCVPIKSVHLRLSTSDGQRKPAYRASPMIVRQSWLGHAFNSAVVSSWGDESLTIGHGRLYGHLFKRGSTRSPCAAPPHGRWFSQTATACERSSSTTSSRVDVRLVGIRVAPQ